MKNCVFCRIAAGDLPSAKLYEDERVVAFLDIAPLNKGHALIVPKEPHNSVTTLPPDYAGRMMQVAARLGQALMRAVKSDGFNLILSNGACAGQVVPHTHLHVIPRHPDDGLVLPHRSVAYASEAEKAELVEQVKARLAP